MLVKNLNDYLKEILSARYVAIDTETTGLHPYKGDRPFLISIYADGVAYSVKDIESNRKAIQEILTKQIIFMHNAKFDMHMFYVEHFNLNSYVLCTMAMARLYKNDEPSYSLDVLGSKIGYPKDKTVTEYINKNKLFEWITYPGKKKRTKKPYYNQVPDNIIVPYCERDTEVCYKLGEHLIDQEYPRQLFETETQLTNVLFSMEATGIKIDRAYTEKMFKVEQDNIRAAELDFLDMTGLEHQDARSVYVEAFNRLNLNYPTTEKGNPSFKAEVLDGIDHPVVDIIKGYRDAYKKAYTYYNNFLDLADSEDVIHCNFNQAGTTTGRLSSSNPNLQNVSGDLRKCFIPREGYQFFMLDYDQMEYRMLLDYAGEEGVIKQVLDGVDVHTATAELMGVERKAAKTINFMLLYGGGVAKLAAALDITEDEAKELKNLYFGKLPKISSLISQVNTAAKARGYIKNWAGRICRVPPDQSYKAVNYLIQGGCADVVKRAMVGIDNFLNKTPNVTTLLLNVHDELVFEIDKSDTIDVKYLKKRMEKAYPYKLLPMTVGVDYSDTNWCDKKEWK